jgi:hypothetical protein
MFDGKSSSFQGVENFIFIVGKYLEVALLLLYLQIQFVGAKLDKTALLWFRSLEPPPTSWEES